MRVCNCTLPYINSNACKTCANNQDYLEFIYPEYEPEKVYKYEQIPKKITKKYDEKSNLIEEIIEEL